MAQYEKHPRIEGKFQCPDCDYGRADGRSRQGVSRHYKNEHTGDASPVTPEVAEEPTEPKFEEVLEVGVEEPEMEFPDWFQVGPEEADGEIRFDSIGSPMKSLLSGFANQDPNRRRSVDELRAFYRQQAKMMRWLFAGVVDPLVSAYGRGVMGENGKGWRIERTEDDWLLFEGISEQWIEYHGFEFPVNPDLLMVGCLGAFYAPPVIDAHRKRDPNRITLFGKVKGRFARWRANRALKRAGVEEFAATN